MGLDGRSGGPLWEALVPAGSPSSEGLRAAGAPQQSLCWALGAAVAPGPSQRGRGLRFLCRGAGPGPGAAPGPAVCLLGGPAASQQNRGTWGWPLGQDPRGRPEAAVPVPVHVFAALKPPTWRYRGWRGVHPPHRAQSPPASRGETGRAGKGAEPPGSLRIARERSGAAGRGRGSRCSPPGSRRQGSPFPSRPPPRPSGRGPGAGPWAPSSRNAFFLPQNRPFTARSPRRGWGAAERSRGGGRGTKSLWRLRGRRKSRGFGGCPGMVKPHPYVHRERSSQL